MRRAQSVGSKHSSSTIGDALKAKGVILSPFIQRELNQPIPQIRQCGEVSGYSEISDPYKATARDRQELIDHWQEFEDLWNDFFRTNKNIFGDMHICTEYQRKSRPRGGVDEVLGTWLKRNQASASKSGILYSNHIRTIQDVLMAFATEDGRSITVLGALQSGKTTLNVGLSLIGPLMFLHSQFAISYAPLLLVPPLNSLYNESTAALLNFFALYSDIDIISNNKIVRPWKYFEQKNVIWLLDKGLATTLNAYEYYHLCRNRGDQLVKADVPIKLAKRQRGMLQAHASLNQIVKDGHSPLIIYDETQWGPNKDGVTGKFGFDRMPGEEYAGRTVKDVCEDPQTKPRFIHVSGTPYPATGASNTISLSLHLDPKYHGWNWSNKLAIDPSCTNSEPKIRSFSDINDCFQTDMFQYMDTRAYNNAATYRRIIDPEDSLYIEGADVKFSANHYSHREYKLWFENNLVGFINAATEINKDFADRDDMAFRLINHNDPTDEIVERIASRLDNAVTIVWNGDLNLATVDGKKITTVAETISYIKTHSGGKAVVVFVTGRARMGDPFPESVRHFVEFSREASNHVSLEQGFFGRACGYNKKRNAVYYNDKEAKRVQVYVESNGDWSALRKKLMPGVKKVQEADGVDFRYRGTLPDYMVLEPITTELQSLFDAIEPIVKNLVVEPETDAAELRSKKNTGNKTLDELITYKEEGGRSRRVLPVFGKGPIPMPDGSFRTINWRKSGSLRNYILDHPEICRKLYGADTVEIMDKEIPKMEFMYDFTVDDMNHDADGNILPSNRIISRRGQVHFHGGKLRGVCLRMVRIDANGNIVRKDREGNTLESPKIFAKMGHKWKLYQIAVPVTPPGLANMPKRTVGAQTNPEKLWQG